MVLVLCLFFVVVLFSCNKVVGLFVFVGCYGGGGGGGYARIIRSKHIKG